jgi:large subunit ribosomal protein L19
MDALQAIEAKQLKEEIVSFKPGDTLRVHFNIVEGANERIQVFEGLCLYRQNSGIRATFTVRKMSYGVGVERVFPVHSPRVQRIEVVRRGRVRRAKLYYLRDRVGKAAKVTELLTKKSRGEAKS